MIGSYVFPVVIIPLLLLLFIVTRFFTVLFHELGHAIPAMLFSREKVTIYLGSYGDLGKSWHLSLHRKLTIYFKINLLKWRGGMVVPGSDKLSVTQNLIISLAGPLFSLVIAIVGLGVIFSFDLNGFLKLLFIIFSFSALFDLRNIYPIEDPLLLSDGTYTYNDGYQIRQMLTFKKDNKILVSAYEGYNKGQYAEAIELFNALNPSFINNDIFNIVLTAYCYDKNYAGGKEFYQKIMTLPNMQSPDSNSYANIGVIESYLGNNELAMEFYNKSLELNSENILSLSNRGYTYNLFEQYNEAIIDFDKAIENDPGFAYTWTNRGYSKIKLNLLDEGLMDINKSMALDDSNAYAYRNLGLYYLEKNDYAESLKNLQKALDIDPDTHMIKDYLRIVEARVSPSKLDLT